MLESPPQIAFQFTDGQNGRPAPIFHQVLAHSSLRHYLTKLSSFFLLFVEKLMDFILGGFFPGFFLSGIRGHSLSSEFIHFFLSFFL